MDDIKCRKILKQIYENTDKAYKYENRAQDCAALNYAIDILSERILNEKHSSMYDQVAKAFEKEDK